MRSIVQIIRSGLGWLPVGVLAVADAEPPTLSFTPLRDVAIDVSVTGGVVDDGWILQDSYNGADWRDLAVMDGRPVRFFLSSVPTRTRLFRAAMKPMPTPQEALTQARAKWQAAGMVNYQYRSRTSVVGFLTDDLTLVQDGVVREWTSLLPPGSPAFAWGDQTIEDLFDRLQSALDNDAHVVFARYHPELGYPETGFVDRAEAISHEEWGFSIIGLPSDPEVTRAENQRRWERSGVEAYEFDLRFESSLSTWEGRVRVTGGTAVLVGGGEPAPGLTIDDFFARIEAALAEGKVSSAAYHSDLGYPEFFSRDWPLTLADGPGERYWISNLRPLGEE